MRLRHTAKDAASFAPRGSRAGARELCGAQRTAVQIMTAWTLPALQRACWTLVPNLF
ncbi:hypothetical protein LMG28140_01398 [Paraburkholderia metrosideri]|uniref:Uncharacterized protein n=1 Tax=Paraburkholderia metrosideri TaxID=580937 RepID=A0ABM8NFI0_9BURK|nr:hypothetical protein LMG28140_01398 [Paraburkholderia metrosideri]